MSPTSGANGNGQSAPELAQQKWSGAPILRLVHEVNDRCIETLQRLANRTPPGNALDLSASLRSLCRKLDVTARQRAATCPFLLLDVHFQSETWWRRAQQSRLPRAKDATRSGCLPARPGAALMRETLVLAWHATRLDQPASSLLLGVSRAVAELIAAMGLEDIERLAESQHAHLRPRWEDRVYFWRQLLIAAQSRDDETLHELHLHGLQLAGGELIPHGVRYGTHSSSIGDA